MATQNHTSIYARLYLTSNNRRGTDQCSARLPDLARQRDSKALTARLTSLSTSTRLRRRHQQGSEMLSRPWDPMGFTSSLRDISPRSFRPQRHTMGMTAISISHSDPQTIDLRRRTMPVLHHHQLSACPTLSSIVTPSSSVIRIQSGRIAWTDELADQAWIPLERPRAMAASGQRAQIQHHAPGRSRPGLPRR
jgi:hypothetical protein